MKLLTSKIELWKAATIIIFIFFVIWRNNKSKETVILAPPVTSHIKGPGKSSVGKYVKPLYGEIYEAQSGQDKYLAEIFFNKHKRGQPGYFIEFGARDGVAQSNTWFFEKQWNWKGLMAEVIPDEYEQLYVKRPLSLSINGAFCPIRSGKMNDNVEFIISTKGGWHGLVDTYHKDRIEEAVAGGRTIQAPCYNLNKVLRENGLFYVDYFTIDTEGSEPDILESIDFDSFNIQFVQVEILTINQPPSVEDEAFAKHVDGIMYRNHYDKVAQLFVSGDTQDYLYRRSDIRAPNNGIDLTSNSQFDEHLVRRREQYYRSRITFD